MMLRWCLLGMALVTVSSAMAQTMHGMQMAPPSANDAPSTRDYREAMRKMEHGMAIPYTGDADKDFASGMIAHHQGAIDMAKVELQYGKDPDLRKLAKEIVGAQTKEIALMRAWHAKHKRSAPGSGAAPARFRRSGGVQQIQRALVNFHILAERDRRRLHPTHQ